MHPKPSARGTGIAHTKCPNITSSHHLPVGFDTTYLLGTYVCVYICVRQSRHARQSMSCNCCRTPPDWPSVCRPASPTVGCTGWSARAAAATASKQALGSTNQPTHTPACPHAMHFAAPSMLQQCKGVRACAYVEMLIHVPHTHTRIAARTSPGQHTSRPRHMLPLLRKPHPFPGRSPLVLTDATQPQLPTQITTTTNEPHHPKACA
jgi:hypothetical protein